MSTRLELLARLQADGQHVEHRADNVRGIPSCLLRSHDVTGDLVVTVGGDLALKDAVGAFVDTVALADSDGAPTASIRLGRREDASGPGVVAALYTLRDAYQGRVQVGIEVEDDDGQFVAANGGAAQFTGVHRNLDARLTNWNKMLCGWYKLAPTGLAADMLAAVGRDSLRLYPQLTTSSSSPMWSLRLDGLQIGKIGTSDGWLRVGSQPSAKDPVAKWLAVTDGDFTPVLVTPESLVGAASLIKRFADSFEVTAGVTNHGQPEHSLESAVLRTAVRVEVDGRALRVPFEDRASFGTVAWGSQFPTLWWPKGKARYLDALLRDGRRPWAVEMKVASGSGYGRYLRQGLTQAVLYRHFIRTATQLRPWFDMLDMDAALCESAVLLPTPPSNKAAKVGVQLASLEELAAAFRVPLLTVSTPGLH